MTTAALLPRATTGRPRLVTRPFAFACATSLANLTGFYLLLSVVPARIVAAGASDGAAGLVTGALMLGGVLAECVAAGLMARFGDRAVLAAGMLLGVVTSLVLIPADGVVVAVAVSALRGVGFGLAVVVIGALVATHVPAGRRGEGLAISGFVSSVSAVAALPAGVLLADAFGSTAVFMAGAAVAAVGFGCAMLTPGRGRADRGQQRASIGLHTVVRLPGQRRPAVVFAATTVAAGIVVAFLPLAASGPAAAVGLFVQALAATVARYAAGWFGDRHGHARLLVPGLVVSGVGMVMLFAIGHQGVLVAAMAVFGIGFGIAQSATFAVMVERAPDGGQGAVSALWNLAYDLGYGFGPLAYGAAVGVTGHPAAFALTGVAMLVALRPAWRARDGR